jgi:hypothetical protein
MDDPNNRKDELRKKKSGKGTRQPFRIGDGFDRGLEDRGSPLIHIELKEWTSIISDVRKQQLEALDDRYHGILTELYDSANVSVDRYQSFSKAHANWRRTLIIGTGLLAVVNLFAANKYIQDHTHNVVAVCAATFSVLLAILANLESFSNSHEKAQAYRESRELFLDVAREFDRRWDIYVRPLGESPEACVNAAELYRQVLVRDRELRAKLKELTKTEARAPRRTP